MASNSRIDVHSHFIPEFYRRAIEAFRVTAEEHFPLAPWSLDAHLANMAAHGIDASVISISDPGVTSLGPGPEANDLARSVNEEADRIIRSNPGRFGGFALLPMPDVAAALDEIADALDRLGLDGVGLLTNYDGVYLGDPRFDAVLDNLNARRAVVFVHPTEPPGFHSLSLGLWAPALEFPFDTTRCVASLLLANVPKRFPDIRFIFSHGGGTLPFLSHRLAPFVAARLAGSAGEVAAPATIRGGIAEILRLLGGFHYDVAAVTHPGALAALRQFVRPSQLMLGFDFPFMPPVSISPALSALEGFEGYSDADRELIFSGTARSLFPRFSGHR